MATFTMELYKVLELEEDSGTGHKIGLSDYPVPSKLPEGVTPEAFREALNEKIIRHYYTREIGMETISLFVFAVRRRMWEAMPPLVKLYESELLVLDPLQSIRIESARNDETEEQGSREGTSIGNSSGTSTSRAINSDFPQGLLSNESDYASSGGDSTGASTSTTSGTNADSTTGKTTGTGSSTTTGFQGSVNRLLQEYRGTILNVDMLVIGALADCFMQVWDNGEELLPAHHPFLELY